LNPEAPQRPQAISTSPGPHNLATSIVILSGPVDKRLFLQRYRPVVTPRIHDPNCLSQLAKNSLSKADESIAAAAQQQAMFPPDDQARAGHKKPVPGVNQLDQQERPIASQSRQPLALKINVLDFILKNLIAKPAKWHCPGGVAD